MTAEEKEALKARKKAYDAERQKETYQRKKEAIAQGIPLMARPVPPPPLPVYKSGMRSDYEENYGDFEPNYEVALAEAKAQDYDIEEWKEAWDEEEAKRKKGIPEEFSESDLREFAPWKHLLRNKNGDILTKNYEWVGKLIIKIKGGKPVETVKRVEPPAYLLDDGHIDRITEEEFAEIEKEIAKPPVRDSLSEANWEHTKLVHRLTRQAETEIFGRPLSIEEKVERERADERAGVHTFAILQNKALKRYWELMNKARPITEIKLIDQEGDE